MLVFEGSNFFRQRLVFSTLSGKAIIIKNIRENDESPGMKDYEISFIRLLDSLTNGTEIVVNETGTTIKYQPGLLLGGSLEHKCCIQRSIGYYLQPLITLAPFCKKPVNAKLYGVTNDSIDPSVDSIKLSALPVLKRFIIIDEGLDLKIISRGLPPDGGGEVIFQCPVVNYLRPFKNLDPGKIKRIRGVAYAVRVSPAFMTRMVDEAKGLLLKFLPDVYIHTDHYKGIHSGKSPGYGITLIAESTTGAFLAAESISRPSGSPDGLIVPEDVARNAVHNLFEEIYRGGCVDSDNQSMAFLFMALGTTDISKIKTGPLSQFTIEFLRDMETFFQVKMKLETEKTEDLKLGTHKVIATCMGIGYTNISRITS